MESNDGGRSKTKTFQDLRSASSKWNLNNDADLLEILETIHKDIVAKSVGAKQKCESNAAAIGAASISLMNINNRFSGLCNTQFVENNVQEDDVVLIKENKDKSESLTINNESLNLKNKENEESILKERISNAVLKSLNNFENLCEEIQISSDTESESDDDDQNDKEYSVILRPKDPYIDKPLPYIIGSQKWTKLTHTELQQCISDEDIENEIETENEDEYSNSDEVQDERKKFVPIPSAPKSSDNQSSVNSTATYNSSDTVDSEIVKNKISTSTPFNTSDNLIADPIHVPAPQTLVKPSDFAAELAKKLGTPMPGNQPSKLIDPPVKVDQTAKPKMGSRTDMFPKPAPRTTNNIFLDEPPPLDSTIVDNKTDLFTGYDENLNDDDVSSGLFGGRGSSDNLFSPKTMVKEKIKSNYGGLFDDIPEDDDDLFSSSNIKKSNPISEITKTKPAESHKETIVARKETISKINKELASKKDILQKKDSTLFNDSDSDDNLFGFSKTSKNDTPKSNIPASKPTKKIETKTASLFDDFSDSDSDLFGSSKKLTKKETDQYPDNSNKKPKTASISTNIGVNKKKSLSLFDDSDSDIDTNSKSKPVADSSKPKSESVSNKQIEVKKNNIFDDLSDSNSDTHKNSSKMRDDKINNKNDVKKPQQLNHSQIPIRETKIPPYEPKTASIKPINVPVKPTNVPPKPENASEISKDVQVKIKKNTSESQQDVPIKQEDSLLSNDAPVKPQIVDSDSKISSTTEAISSIDKAADDSKYQLSSNDTTLFSNLFDDVPPPIGDSSDDGIFNEPSDLFSNIPKLEDKLSNTLFDDNIDIFSDIPPDYNEPTEQKPSDLFDDPSENFYGDTDYPYFKKVNMVGSKKEKNENVSPIESIPKNKGNSGLFSESDDELFSNKKSQGITNSEKSSIFKDKNIDDELFGGKVKKEDSSNPENSVLPNKAVSTQKEKQEIFPEKESSSIEKKDFSKKNEETDGAAISTTKKLDIRTSQKKAQLNINVKALLPSGNKTISEINKTIKQDSSAEMLRNDEPKETTIIKSVSFDDDPKSTDSTLGNDLLKNRAKIPVKRRPSSRKARHDAVRKSAADIYTGTDDDSTDYTQSVPSSPEKKLLDTKLENTKKLDEVQYSIDKTEEKNKNSTTKNIFDDSDDDLFSSRKVAKRDQINVENKTTIENQNSITEEKKSSSPQKISSKTSTQKTEQVKIQHTPNTSIFDDSDDNIFSSTKKVSKEKISPSNLKPETSIERIPVQKEGKATKSFFENSDEENIFSINKKESKESTPSSKDDPRNSIKNRTQNEIPTGEHKVEKPKTKSFFDDSDDDGLFSSNKIESKDTTLPINVDRVTSIQNQTPKVEEAKAKTPQTRSFFEDSDDDDIFSSNKKNKSILKTEKKSTKSIFEDSDSDSDLFSSKVKKKPKEKESVTKSKEKSKSIFDDDDSDDLFQATSNTRPPPNNTKGAIKKSNAPTNPLFDDDDELFSTNKGKKTINQRSADAAKLSTNSRNDSSFEDPLSSFLNS